MPPKKKKGKGGGKKKGKGKGKGKKGKDDVKLELEEQYGKTMSEISALKDQLAIRREITVRAQSAKEDMWRKMEQTEQNLLDKEDEKKAVASEMTRQYKTMQTKMGVDIDLLENELHTTRERLKQTEVKLQKTLEEKELMSTEKDLIITNLQCKIESMDMAYKSELDAAMDSLLDKLDVAKQQWSHESTMIQAKNKNTLLEFGLNPLDI